MVPNDDWFHIDSVLTPSDLRSRRGSLEPRESLGIKEPLSPCFEDRIDYLHLPALPSRTYDDPDDFHDLPPLPAHCEPPPWNVGFSKQFKKDLGGLDRKLAGRVLEALLVVTNFAIPFAVVGDTFKPLSGKLASCWRYRIGDHRLILQPQPEDGMIFVVTFASRGDVYE